ncbi:rhodanese-like domain-containing protein [Stutzerimonas xanthomarina]|uniref:rhodanese-like domain-containing protein n=1 Tax=Stutzerimonas xanthomarina TaxID=271420 RepID=UPI003AA9A69A
MNKPLLSDLLHRLVPLNTLPSRYLQEIRHQLVPRALAPGDVLFDEQTPSGLSYFLLSGTLSLLTPDGERPLVAGSPESCHVIASGVRVSRVCALEALLTDAPRNATVTLIEDACVLKLARESFVSLLKAPVVDELSLEQANALIEQGAQWLDVRLLEEYEQGHARLALTMPLHLLRLKARLLQQDRLYLCYCDSGKRSASAVFLLTQLGFSAYPLRGGLDGLSAEDYVKLLCEQGNGYLARSGGRTERSG